jgi:hypothetical protein
MPRGVKKENLPTKICVTCNRPFTWRKKWERVWDEVTTCSKSCNNKRRQKTRQQHFHAHAAEIYGGSFNNLNKNKQLSELQTSPGSDSSHQAFDEEEYILDLFQVRAVDSDENVDSEIGNNNNNNNNSVENESSEGEETASYNGAPTEPPTDHLDAEVTNKAAARKALKEAKKAKKAERRAQRQGNGNPDAGKKPCDMCGEKVNLLIRCMHEQGQVDWSMVCGTCWHKVSGGVPDGDASHPHYRYGGLWKNRRAQQQ